VLYGLSQGFVSLGEGESNLIAAKLGPRVEAASRDGGDLVVAHKVEG
jgi:hypothetical protein